MGFFPFFHVFLSTIGLVSFWSPYEFCPSFGRSFQDFAILALSCIQSLISSPPLMVLFKAKATAATCLLAYAFLSPQLAFLFKNLSLLPLWIESPTVPLVVFARLNHPTQLCQLQLSQVSLVCVMTNASLIVGLKIALLKLDYLKDLCCC